MRILNQFYFSQLSINLLWNYLTKADPISMIGQNWALIQLVDISSSTLDDDL